MPEREKRVRFAAFLNFAFTIVEIVGGLWTNSLAILSDALHDFGDSIALLVSWLFERGAKRSPDAKYTFGYQRLSLFSALFAAAVLVGGSIVIIFQAIPRFFNPEPVNAFGMVGIAVFGIAFNGLGFFLLKRGESLNEKVLSWHLLEDTGRARPHEGARCCPGEQSDPDWAWQRLEEGSGGPVPGRIDRRGHRRGRE